MNLQDVANIATIVAASGIVIALFEYWHSVKLARQQNRRASVELAARECTHFGTVIMQEFQELRRKLDSQTTFMKDCKVELLPNNLRYDPSTVPAEELAKMKLLADEALRVFNRLEGFAIPFVEGVADDAVGFEECGRAYVEIFEKNLPLFAFTNPKHYYRKSQRLYWLWKKRIVKHDFQIEVCKQAVELTEKVAEESGGPLARFAAKWLRKNTGI